MQFSIAWKFVSTNSCSIESYDSGIGRNGICKSSKVCHRRSKSDWLAEITMALPALFEIEIEIESVTGPRHGLPKVKMRLEFGGLSRRYRS